MTRRFANGWAVGAYFTLTDVTAEDFGEGSFDKGVYDLRSRSAGRCRSRPGATNTHRPARRSRATAAPQLDISNRLYPIVRDFDRDRLKQNWGSFWQ